MLHNSLINKLKKLGYPIEKTTSGYKVLGNTTVLSWGITRDGAVVCPHIKCADEESDMRMDYFPGWFPNTIKAIIEDLKR